MRAGSLKHRIIIEHAVALRDEYNDVSNVWEALYPTRANVQPISGREYHDLHAQQSEVDIKIVLRYRPGINNKMRIIWQNRLLEIIDVIDVEGAGKELQLMCCDRGGMDTCDFW